MNLRSHDRIHIRTRESGVTHSAWRMEVETEDGIGTITLVDSGASTIYRGGGAFLGWTQEQLAAAYKEAQRPDDEPPVEFQQFG